MHKSLRTASNNGHSFILLLEVRSLYFQNVDLGSWGTRSRSISNLSGASTSRSLSTNVRLLLYPLILTPTLPDARENKECRKTWIYTFIGLFHCCLVYAL
jgi:hypothetical protein